MGLETLIINDLRILTAFLSKLPNIVLRSKTASCRHWIASSYASALVGVPIRRFFLQLRRRHHIIITLCRHQGFCMKCPDCGGDFGTCRVRLQDILFLPLLQRPVRCISCLTRYHRPLWFHPEWTANGVPDERNLIAARHRPEPSVETSHHDYLIPDFPRFS